MAGGGRVCPQGLSTWSALGAARALGKSLAQVHVLVKALGGPVRGLLTAPQIPELQQELPPPLLQAAQ